MEHIIELIKEYPINKHMYQSYVDFRDKTDTSYKIQFFNNNIYQITNFDNQEHTNHLINIIKKEQLDDINYIYDLLIFLENNIDNIQQYCVICQNKLNWQSQDFLACDNYQCQILYEESLFGNYVIECYKQDIDIFKFHIASAIEAINCKNAKTRFEPFPQSYMNTSKIYNRNILENSNDDDYINNKNIDKLKEIANNIQINNIIEICKYCDSDLDIRNKIGNIIYKLLRFIVLTVNVKIIHETCFIEKYPNLKNTKIYKVDHQSYKNEEYNI